MNDEDLVSTNALEAPPSSDDPFAAQDAEARGSAEGETAKGADPCQPIADCTVSEDGGAATPALDSALSDDPVSNSDPVLPEDPDPSEAQSLEQLRDELKHLREEIREREDFYGRVGREYEEFRTLYPGVSLSDLPDGVWKDVKCGIPIAAAYALAEQRRQRLAEQADAVNRTNAARSSGSLSGADPEIFTSAEVRAMSRDEVRRNYQKIMNSMKKWN